MRTGKLMARNSLFLISAALFNLVVSIFTTSAIAKSIGTELFGKYTFGLSLIVLFSVMANFGLESLFVREASRDRENIRRLIYDVFAIKCLLALGTLAAIITFSYLMGYDESTITVIQILSIGLFFQIASDVIGAIYRSLERMHLISISSMLFRTITAAIIFASVYSDIGFWGIVWSYTIGRIMVFFFLVVHLDNTYGIGRIQINVRTWYQLIRRGAPFYLSAIFTMLYMKMTVLFLAETHGEHEIGIYMAAAILVESLLFLPNSISMILFSAFSRIYGTSLEALGKAYARSMKYILIIIAAVMTGTMLISERVILLIYGAEFQDARAVLNVLILFWGLAFLSQIMSNLLFAINKEKLQVKVMGITCFANLMLNFLLVPRFGSLGSASSFFLSELLATSLMVAALWRNSIRYLPDSCTARLVPVLLIMVTVVATTDGLNLGLSVALGALAYSLFLFILKVFDEKDLEYFRKIFRKDLPAGYIQKPL